MGIYAYNNRDSLTVEWSGFSSDKAFIKKAGSTLASFSGSILSGKSQRYIGYTNSDVYPGNDYVLITDKGSTRQFYLLNEGGSEWESRGGLNKTINPYYKGFEKAVLADLNNDGTIEEFANFYISNASFTEGDNNGHFEITRAKSKNSYNDGSFEVSFNLDWSNGTAIENSDWIAGSNSVTFSAGEITKKVAFQITDDSSRESQETFSVKVSSANENILSQNLIISENNNSTSRITIDDDDSPSYISYRGATILEGDKGYVEITRSGAVNRTTTVKVFTEAEGAYETASSGLDYISDAEYENGGKEITFEEGETTKRLEIIALQDSLVEEPENLVVWMSTIGNDANTILRPDVEINGEVNVWIRDISSSPTYSITSSTTSIDEKSESSVRFNISTTDVDANTRLYYTLSPLSGSDVTASDFSSGNIKSSRLIGSDGNATFVLSAATDKTTEGTETFNVKLYSDYQRTKLVATSSDVSIADTSKGQQSAALLSASVSAKTITLNFDSSLSNTKPATQRFKVTADGKSIRISSSSLNADAGSLKLNLASAINPNQSVKLAYTDLKGDQSNGVLQTTDGTDLSSFSTAVSNNSSDSTAPTVTDATINGKALTLSFDEAIAKATPSNRSWTLKEDGKAISITSASVDSSSAQLDLTLSTAVDLGSNITLSYRDLSGDQKANVIQDLAGNDLASFSNFSVENQTTRSSDPLDLNTAEINGNEIVLAFNRELSTTTPSTGTFRLRANNKAIKVNSITLSPKDREAVLKIASSVAHGDNVTLSYTDAQGNQKSNVIEDVDGNDLATINNFKLTNNTRKSAEGFEVDYADADGKIINLYLTDSLSSSIPKAARFRVTADNRKQKIGSVSTSQSDGIITLSLKKSINPKQDILISYRDLKGDQRSGVAEDTDGNDLASFQNLSPSNDTSSFDEITDNNPPSLEDAYLDGKELILEFDKSLQTGKVGPSRFKLRAGKKRVRVASALVPTDDDSTAILTLKSPLATSANSLSLTYKDLKGDQSSNIIQDDSGNDLASLRNFSVEII